MKRGEIIFSQYKDVTRSHVSVDFIVWIEVNERTLAPDQRVIDTAEVSLAINCKIKSSETDVDVTSPIVNVAERKSLEILFCLQLNKTGGFYQRGYSKKTSRYSLFTNANR